MRPPVVKRIDAPLTVWLVMAMSTGARAAHDAPPSTPPSAPLQASAPSIRFLHPADGQVVRGVVRIILEVTPAQGISQALVLEHRVVLGVALTPPFEVAWDTRRVPEGPHQLTAKAVDVDFQEGLGPAITVTVDNTPPTVTLVAPTEGQHVVGPVRLEVQAGDNLDVQAVRFLVNGQAVGDVTQPPYALEWDSTHAPNIAHGIEARVFDRAGNSARSQTVTVKVANFNHHPVLDPISAQIAAEGTAMTFIVHAQDADGARDPLTYQAFNLPAWAAFDSVTGVFTGTPGPTEASLKRPEKVYAGVRFEACDPEPLCDSQEITITVVDHNSAPMLQPLTDYTIGEESPLTIALAARDPDGDPLVCAAALIPPWAAFDPSSCVLTGTPGPEVATLEEPAIVYPDVHFTVCDPDELCAARTITITVENVENRPPVVVAVPPQTAEEGRLLTVTVHVEDPDRDTIALAAAPLPDGAIFTDHGDRTGTLTWTPRYDQAGIYQVAVMASDGSLRGGAPATITVRERSLAVSGVVVDRSGHPLAGAEVELSTGSAAEKKATTDAQGYYLLTGISPGVYRVQPHYTPPEVFSSVARKNTPITFYPPFTKVTITDHDHTGVGFILE